MKILAVVRIRGDVGLKQEVRATMKMLRLFKKNNCAIVTDSPNYLGMLMRIKDYVTWGELDEKVLKELLDKRGKLPGKARLTEEYLKEKMKMDYDSYIKEFYAGKKKLKDVPGLKPYFKLHPPVGGFERKGIKTPFSLGGVLGYRKDKINDLIKKMI